MDAASEPVEEAPRRRLLRDPRVLVVLVLALGALLVGSVVFTVATFTGQSTNAGVIRAGSLVFDVTPVGAAIDTSSLRPGATRSGLLDVVNRQVKARFTLDFTGRGSGGLSDVLQLTVAEVSPLAQTLWQGKLAAAPPIALGTIETGKSVRLRITFDWPAGTNAPELQGQTVPLVFQWQAST